MPEHPDFTIVTAPHSDQALLLLGNAGDVVRLLCDNTADRAVLAGAIETSLVLFEILKKKGD